LFRKLEGYKGKVELVLIDAYRGYEKFVEKYLADGGEKPLTGIINKSEYSETEGFVTYALFGGKRESVEAKISSLGLGKKITTDNHLKAHLTLSGKSSKNWITVPVTPCMEAGICDHQISLIEIPNFRFITPTPK